VTTGATHFDTGKKDAADPVEREGCRPDFVIAIYPVVSMQDGITHGGSRRNLLGREPDPKLVESLSNETQVTPQTPPTFLVHATDDRAVKVENAINFYLAVRRAGVPAAMHIYQSGGHGFGLRDRCFAGKDWPGRCAAWLRENGMIRD
jgi:acetyl esterase/lipase